MFTQSVGFVGLSPVIIQAPMAGGVTTPELVASVSNAGGIGSFATGYLTTEQVREGIKQIKKLTDKPFAVNLFIPNKPVINDAAVLAYQKALKPIREVFGLPEGSQPQQLENNFDELIDVIFKESIKLVSITFGNLSDALIQRFKSKNIYLMGTATSVEEAKALEASGIDAIVAQGREAGGHRGNFITPDSESVPLDTLIRDTKAEVTCPVIAAGGIMNAEDIKRVIDLGADAVQLGTAFLTVLESGANTYYQKALLEKRETVLTKAFTGKMVRGLNTAFIQAIENEVEEIPDYPLAHCLSAPIRKEAAKQGKTEYMSMWCGEGFSRLREGLTAKALMSQLHQGL